MDNTGIYVIDVSRSSYAIVEPLPIDRVIVDDSFWRPRLEKLVKITLPLQFLKIQETGRLENFRMASGRVKGEFKGLWFNDSDVYKWIEASAYALAYRWSEELYKMVNTAIDEIISAQQPDGYINTYITVNGLKRWVDLAWSHELYCAGHLIQAAIAVRRSLKKNDLYVASLKFADLISDTFGWEEGKLKTSDGHPEIEMALVELYRECNRGKYLDLAEFFIDIRGRGYVTKTLTLRQFFLPSPEYLVDHKPIRELDDIAGGHAVRALYYMAGVADVYIEKGDSKLWSALKSLWRKVTSRKMYITYGFGSRYEGEAFGEDYELPNERAYSETCASVAGAMWAWRMFLASGDPKYVEVLESILYNSALAGISLDGTRYFYVNPLADYYGKHQRMPWFECACCPPNIARLLAYLPSMIYSFSKIDKGIMVNLFIGSRAVFEVNGNRIAITMDTMYPWYGKVFIRMEPERVDEIPVMIRIPSWVEEHEILVNGKEFRGEPGRYIKLVKSWDRGDKIVIEFKMRPRFIQSHPYVEANYGRVAIKRGPIVYCIEGIDNREFDVRDLIIDPSTANLNEVFREDVLNGVVLVEGEGYVNEDMYHGDKLYYELDVESVPKAKKVKFIAIPYYAWNNRGATQMAVWIRSRINVLGRIGD
ncbi:MAG: glycoside hydrolase family 127 protein [Ignisphaera sp.]